MNKYILHYENWDKEEEIICSKQMITEIIMALADWSGVDTDEIQWEKDEHNELTSATFCDDCGAKFTMIKALIVK